MYYQQDIPLMLWFFCAHPASQDGETIVCDGRQFYTELSNPLKELFSNKKLKYSARLDKEAWQKRYKTDDLKEVEQICIKNNLMLQIDKNKNSLLF
jgi:hypothetical protein